MNSGMLTADLIVAAVLGIVLIIGIVYLTQVMDRDPIFDAVDAFMQLGFPLIVLGIGLGIVFVIAHFAIKYW
jgi:hypothetical protein